MTAKPSELELQVLGLLWEHGPRSVRDLLPLFPDGKERAYTTVLTVLQGMERKKLVDHRQEGLTYIYSPLVSHEQVVQPVLKTMLKNLFAGNPAKAVQALMDASDVSPDDLKQIRKIIKQAAREAENKGETP